MLLSIQPDSPVPIYEQIITQILFAVARGDLRPGSLIPSVRELAGRIVVHPNTVARAYQELERRGVLEAKRGRGMEVTDEAVTIAKSSRRELVRGRIRDAVREAISGALTVQEIHQLVDEEWNHLRKSNGTSEVR